MSSQVMQNTSEEGEGGFNFDKWITDNELQDIKPLFIKYNATTCKQLTFVSVEIQKMMTDPELLSQPLMIPKIMSALHNISSYVVTVVVSEAEQAVADLIKQNLKSLSQTETEVQRLKSEYPISKQKAHNQKMKQIETVKTKINSTFDHLFDALNKRKQVLLQQVENIKLTQDAYDDDEKKDDEKETDVTGICEQNIETLRTFLIENEGKYDKLISTNKDKKDRKNNILNIGQNVTTEFNQKQTEIKKRMESITDRINANNECKVDVDCVVDGKVYKQAVDIINNLAQIVSVSNAVKNSIDWKWVPDKPPSTRHYLYAVTNSGKTTEKTSRGDYVYMMRMNPWLSKQNYQNKALQCIIKVDAVGGSVDIYNAVGVITQSYWNEKTYVGGDPGSKNHYWSFKGGVYIGTNKKKDMPAISSVNQIIGIEINFSNNTVGYKLFNNGQRNNSVASCVQKFDAMEKEPICIALSVRKTGWKFTIVE